MDAVSYTHLAARLCEKIDVPNAHICLDAERGVLASLNAGCHEPIGVYARIEENKLILQAAGAVSGPSGDGVKPVSYTHLDVYKRQPQV